MIINILLLCWNYVQDRLVSDRLYNVVEIARASMGRNSVTSTEQPTVNTIILINLGAQRLPSIH